MKYLKLIAFLYTFLIIQVANASSYVVNTPVLNVRSCAGTNCQIIGKLTEGETVDSIQEHGDWIEIKTEKGSGYVIKKSLSEDNTIFSIVILVLILWLVFFIYMLPSKIAANNKNASKIYKVNLFLGWIPVIWLILLLAALIGESKES